MRKTLLAALLILPLSIGAAQASERLLDGALGGAAGGIVFGPVGLVAGAVVGATAGPAIVLTSSQPTHDSSRRCMSRSCETTLKTRTSESGIGANASVKRWSSHP